MRRGPREVRRHREPDCPEGDTDLDTDEDTDATPGNQPPTIEDLALTPDLIRTDDVVTASAVISDPEEDDDHDLAGFVDATGGPGSTPRRRHPVVDKGDTVSVTVEITTGEHRPPPHPCRRQDRPTGPGSITPEEPLPENHRRVHSPPSTDADEDAIAHTSRGRSMARPTP